jgi:hypothetical protein
MKGSFSASSVNHRLASEDQSARWRRLGAGARGSSGSGGAAAGSVDVGGGVACGSARCAISRSSWSKIGVDITLSRAIRALLNVKIRLFRTVTPKLAKTAKPRPTRSGELRALVGHCSSFIFC